MAAYQHRMQLKAPDDAQDAAVLVLLYPKDTVHTVFIKRKQHDEDKHSGQISFPGGKVEEQDRSLVDCALREAHEEIGIQPSNVEIVGQLTPLYIPVSNFRVYPIVGISQDSIEFVPQADEVANILSVPLSILVKPATRKKKDMLIRSTIRLREVPYFDVDGQVIWGATAMILNEFLAIFKSFSSLKQS